MLPFATPWVLPVLDQQIPVELAVGNEKAEAMMEEFFVTRFRLNLPTVRPNAAVHGSMDEVLLASLMKLVGTKPLSEQHLKIDIDPLCFPCAPENAENELEEHFAVYVNPTCVNIRRGILALDATTDGLGRETFARLSKLISRLPGMMSDADIYDMYGCYRLEEMHKCEDCTEDDIRAQLIEYGYEEDGIDRYLPSTILREMGGEDLVCAVPQLSSKEFTARLKAGFAADGVRLAKLLTREIVDKTAAFTQACETFRDGTFQAFSESFNVRVSAAPEDSSEIGILGFIDDMRQDSMNNGDYDANFAINHFESDPVEVEPSKPKRGKKEPVVQPIRTDSLKIIALLLKAFSVVDEAVCLINKLGEKQDA